MPDVKGRIARKCDFSSVFLRSERWEAGGTAFRNVPGLWKLEFTGILGGFSEPELIARGGASVNFGVTAGIEAE